WIAHFQMCHAICPLLILIEGVSATFQPVSWANGPFQTVDSVGAGEVCPLGVAAGERSDKHPSRRPRSRARQCAPETGAARGENRGLAARCAVPAAARALPRAADYPGPAAVHGPGHSQLRSELHS